MKMMLINNNIKGKTSECIKYLLNNFSFQIQFKVYITEIFFKFLLTARNKKIYK